jgi:hypothetical protein
MAVAAVEADLTRVQLVAVGNGLLRLIANVDYGGIAIVRIRADTTQRA